MKILLLLPFILIAMSCTVTKRVHRPGYHVVWHNQQRESQKEQQMDQLDFSDQPTARKSENGHAPANVNSQNAPNQIDLPETQEATSETVDDNAPPSANPKTRSIQQVDSEKSATPNVLPTRKKLADKQSIRPLFWRIPPDSLVMIGIALMGIGGLIFLGSVFALMGAFSGNGNGGWFNFFLDLITISNWFWLLIFLIVIIFVFYLIHLLIMFVLGGPTIALFVSLGMLAFGFFLFVLGKKRSE